MPPAPASLHRTTVRLALLVLGVVLVLALAELTSERFSAFTGDHALISTFIAEAVLLVGVYLVIGGFSLKWATAPGAAASGSEQHS